MAHSHVLHTTSSLPEEQVKEHDDMSSVVYYSIECSILTVNTELNA